MKSSQLLLLMSLAFLPLKQAFAEDAPEWKPDGNGGHTLIFAPKHFQNIKHGKVDDGVFTLQKDFTYRFSIFTTMEIPITHNNGKIDAEIEYEANYIGTVNPLNDDDEPDIFRVDLIVKNGSDRKVHMDYIGVSHLKKKVTFAESRDTHHIIAKSDGFQKLAMKKVEIKKDDKVTLRVTGASPGSSFKIKNIEIHSYPVK